MNVKNYDQKIIELKLDIETYENVLESKFFTISQKEHAKEQISRALEEIQDILIQKGEL